MRRTHVALRLCCPLALLLVPAASQATDPVPHNRVTNSFFDEDVSGWSVDPAQGPLQPYNQVTLVLDADRDLLDDPDSGALQVHSRAPDSGHASGAAVQCVELGSFQRPYFFFDGAILIPSGTPLTVSFTARLRLRFYDTASCEAALGDWIELGSRYSGSSETEVWEWVELDDIPLPLGAESALIEARLDTSGGSQWGQTVVADFDSILLPEPGLRAGSLAALLSLAALRRAARR